MSILGPNPQSQFRDLDKPKPFIVSLTAIQLQTVDYSREHNILEHGGAYTMHRCMMLEHIQILVAWRTQAPELLPEYEELCRELDLDRGLGASAAQQCSLLSLGGYRALCIGVYRNVVCI